MTIETILLKNLNAPQANPRRNMDPAALEGLAASIHADGLLQNLVVRRKGRKYEIVSGERRYRALSLLQERGDIDGNYAVPVEIRRKLSAGDAVRLATVENIQREALAPMDEAEAFARMVTDGTEIADVAAKAGVSKTTVKRRLALSALCDEAKAAVRSGDLPLSMAEALTLGTADQQREIISQMESGLCLDADDIRGWLTEEKPNVGLAIFPLETYTGTLTSDLFADEETTFFDDMEQFHRLQREAIEARAEQHRQTAAFVEIVEGWHMPWWQFDEAGEGEESGVVIHVAPSGRVEERTGLVQRPVPETVKEEVREDPAPAKPRPEYSGPLVRYIAAHKTLAVQAALLADARKAKEVAVVQMMNGYDWTRSRIALAPQSALAAFDEETGLPKAYALIEQIAQQCADVLGIGDGEQDVYARPCRGAWERLVATIKDPVMLYEAVKRLSYDDLDRLHLLLTTLCFGQGDYDALDTGDSLFNRVAQDLGVNMAKQWRPDEAFLSRRSMAQLEDVARESGALAGLGRIKDYKKKGLVAALVRFFERTASAKEADLSEDECRGRKWLPGAMQFPAVSNEPPDEDSEAEGEAA